MAITVKFLANKYEDARSDSGVQPDKPYPEQHQIKLLKQ